jgi:hypothetical protein
MLLLHVAALSTVAAAAAVARLRLRGRAKKARLPATAIAAMPTVEVAESGRLEHLEKFSHYVGE